MIGKQEFAHRPLGFLDFVALRGNDHAVGARDRARSLQLRHFLDPHQTHTTRRLELEVLVIAKRRNSETILAAHVDQTRSFGNLELVSVYRDFN
jgi:hypothetical protein